MGRDFAKRPLSSRELRLFSAGLVYHLNRENEPSKRPDPDDGDD